MLAVFVAFACVPDRTIVANTGILVDYALLNAAVLADSYVRAVGFRVFGLFFHCFVEVCTHTDYAVKISARFDDASQADKRIIDCSFCNYAAFACNCVV